MESLNANQHTGFSPVNIVNLTPHTVDLLMDGDVKSIPSHGVARVAEKTIDDGVRFGIQFVIKSYGEITGLPDPAENVIYIVSMLVASAAWQAGRTDVFYPADFTRDAEGKIVSACSLCGAPEGDE